MNLPKREEAIEIIRQVGCSRGVICHCINVSKIAQRIAKEVKKSGHDIDLELVEIGALLHDIGRSRTHGIMHGTQGGEIARELGLPSTLVNIIERHIGAGIPIEEARELGLPEGNYIPETLEEKIVSYADKLSEGTGEIEIKVTMKKFAEELGVSHPALERLKALHVEITGLVYSQ